MSPDEVFEHAVSIVLENEGGYSWHSADPGGETNMGISRRAYPDLDIKNLTQDEAKAIYKRDYWDAIGAATYPPALAVVALDIAVNHGAKRLLDWLAEEPQNAMSLTARRLEHYASLKSLWPTFGRGWTLRAARVLRAAQKLA